MQGKISQKVFDKITTEGIHMKPKVSFVADFLFWIFLSGLTFFLSTITIGFIYHYWVDINLSRMLVQQPGEFFHQFPYFLVILSILLLYLSSRLYRRSRKQCRHEDWALISTLLLTAVLMGILFMQFTVFSNLFHTFAKDVLQSCVL